VLMRLLSPIYIAPMIASFKDAKWKLSIYVEPLFVLLFPCMHFFND
jgi:hypothetical protein